MSRGMQNKFSGREFGVTQLAHRVEAREGFYLQIRCRTQEAPCVPERRE